MKFNYWPFNKCRSNKWLHLPYFACWLTNLKQITMKVTQNINFINGIFGPNDAKEILVDLLNHKIEFHSMRNFSSEERFGKPNEESCKRMKELKESREKILLIIQQSVDQDTNLKIESSINITFEK